MSERQERQGGRQERPTSDIPAPERAEAASHWSGAHTRHRLRFHLVWIPKYRRRVLTGPVAVQLSELLAQACEVSGWGLEELAVQADHVHLLIQTRPAESVSAVVERLKGGTSRVLRAEFPQLEEFLWGDSFWAGGYFAETVGVVNEAVISQYIRNQRR